MIKQNVELVIQVFTRGKLELSKKDGEIMSLFINNQFWCPNSKQIVDFFFNECMPLLSYSCIYVILLLFTIYIFMRSSCVYSIFHIYHK